MKKFILAALATTTIAAALPTGAMAETTNTVKVTKFHQSYPYTGRATVGYTVGGTLPATAFAEITLRADSASATFIQSNIVVGANSHVIDFASSFGGALVLSNASFTVRINPGDKHLDAPGIIGGHYRVPVDIGIGHARLGQGILVSIPQMLKYRYGV